MFAIESSSWPLSLWLQGSHPTQGEPADEPASPDADEDASENFDNLDKLPPPPDPIPDPGPL